MHLALFLAVAFAAVEWGYGPVLPLAKTCRATATDGNRIVTVGGTWWQTTPDGPVKRWSAEAFLLDAGAASWRSLPRYPLEAGYALAAFAGGSFYVVGGRGTTRGNAEVFSLDPRAPSPQWTPGPRLPRPRWGPVGAAISDVIYIAGGIEGEGPPDRFSNPTSTILALDTKAQPPQWRTVGTLPGTPVEWQMAAACQGRLYLFGGLRTAPAEADKGLMPVSEAYVFDPKTGTCSRIAPLPEPLGSGAAVAIDSRTIAITGGIALAVPGSATPDGKARTHFSAACWLYDTVRSRYTRAAPMRLPVTDNGLVYAGGSLYSVGGEDSSYRTRTDLVQVGRISVQKR